MLPKYTTDALNSSLLCTSASILNAFFSSTNLLVQFSNPPKPYTVSLQRVVEDGNAWNCGLKKIVESQDNDGIRT